MKINLSTNKLNLEWVHLPSSFPCSACLSNISTIKKLSNLFRVNSSNNNNWYEFDMSYKDWVWFGLFEWFWFWGWRLRLKMKKIFSMFIITFNFIFLIFKFLILINFHVCTQLSIFYIKKYLHQLWPSQNYGDHGFVKGVKLKGAKVLFLNLGGQNRKFVKLGGQKCILAFRILFLR